MSDYLWATYLQSHPTSAPGSYVATGARLTALMTQAEQAQFLSAESAMHTGMMQATGREPWHDEWQTWTAALDIGTRVILYYVAFKASQGSDHGANLLAQVLPYEILPTSGSSIDKDRKTYDLLQGYTRDLSAFYDTVAAEHTPSTKRAMTFQEYLTAHPELRTIGANWSTAMTPSELAQFDEWESGFYQWAAQNSTASSAGWTDWTKESKGTRLLLYAGAHDAGLGNAASVALVFPAIIQQPKDANAAQVWFGSTGGGLALFAGLRDSVLHRVGGLRDPNTFEFLPATTGGTTTPGGGNSLVPSGTTSGTGTTATASSGGGMGILLLLIAAAFLMKK